MPAAEQSEVSVACEPVFSERLLREGLSVTLGDPASLTTGSESERPLRPREPALTVCTFVTHGGSRRPEPSVEN